MNTLIKFRQGAIGLLLLISLISSCGHQSKEAPDFVPKISSEYKLMDYGDTFNLMVESEKVPQILSDGATEVLPEKSLSLISLQTKVKDQGQRGQCHNFAVTSAFEYVFSTLDNIQYDFSEQCNAWLFYKDCSNCSFNPESTPYDGGFPRNEILHIKDKFMKFEIDFPYNKDDPAACEFNYASANYKTFSNVEINYIYPKSIYDIKKRIAQNAVVVLVTFWPLSGTNTYGEFPYQENYEFCTPSTCGGHAVVIVGYDDNYYGLNKGGFIFKNSWSLNFGKERIERQKPSGYGVFPYPFASRFFVETTSVSHASF